MPPYFRQNHRYSCSIAILRMVLASKGIEVSEDELVDKIKQNYGSYFKNVWNPTIAKLAISYGIKTTVYSKWNLFQRQNLQIALEEYTRTGQINFQKYEQSNGKRPANLKYAYTDMFEAYQNGCEIIYKQLDQSTLISLLNDGKLIQTSLRLKSIYPQENNSFHSILIYKFDKENAYYHDPDREADMKLSIDKMVDAMKDTGMVMVY